MIDADEVSPMPDEDGAELLDELMYAIERYVVFANRHSAAAVALWIAVTHALPAFQHAPRLVINSPEKRCGKSRLLDVTGGTCHDALMSVSATVPAIFRSLDEEHPPTLLIDEADAIFGTKRAAEQNEDFRALLNAGHQRGRPALRCVGPQQVPTQFPTFAMAALAGIGTMPDTITDRAVNITLRRRAPGERVEDFRERRDGPALFRLRDRLGAWCSSRIDLLSAAEPDMPVEDRAADTWEPLIAVADMAGSHWPETARASCLFLVDRANEDDADRSGGARLLADIRQIYSNSGDSFISSLRLTAELQNIKESPWGEGQPLTTRKLSDLLRGYGIRPAHHSSGRVRGYRLEAFVDTFVRYLGTEPSEPSESAFDLQNRSDSSAVSDASKCQREVSRKDEHAAQNSNLTVTTVSKVSHEGCHGEPCRVCRDKVGVSNRGERDSSGEDPRVPAPQQTSGTNPPTPLEAFQARQRVAARSLTLNQATAKATPL